MTTKQKALAALNRLKDEVETWEEQIENGSIVGEEALDEIVFYADSGREKLEKISFLDFTA